MVVIQQRFNLIQGEAKWAMGDEIVFTTLLGSCVAACIRDPVLGLGGMNHFLLPGSRCRDARSDDCRYGEHLMERLVGGLLDAGARLDRLEAKLFGGARTQGVYSDIGAQNATFATEFLRRRGISYKGGDLGGTRGRRIEYWPRSGQARQIRMQPVESFEKPELWISERA